MSVLTYGDLLEQTELTSKWTDTGLLGVNFLDQILEAREPSHRPITLRAGSCWTMEDGNVLEYIGALAEPEGPPLMFKRWICPAGERLGATLHLSEDTPSLGAGTDLLMHYDDAWPTNLVTRAILVADDSFPSGSKGTERTLLREFSHLRPSSLPSPTLVVTPAQNIVAWLRSNQFEEGSYEIFTDGAW